MERELDRELTARLEQEEIKAVSDQQWHLSIVHESNGSK